MVTEGEGESHDKVIEMEYVSKRRGLRVNKRLINFSFKTQKVEHRRPTRAPLELELSEREKKERKMTLLQKFAKSF